MRRQMAALAAMIATVKARRISRSTVPTVPGTAARADRRTTRPPRIRPDCLRTAPPSARRTHPSIGSMVVPWWRRTVEQYGHRAHHDGADQQERQSDQQSRVHGVRGEHRRHHPGRARPAPEPPPRYRCSVPPQRPPSAGWRSPASAGSGIAPQRYRAGSAAASCDTTSIPSAHRIAPAACPPWGRS